MPSLKEMVVLAVRRNPKLAQHVWRLAIKTLPIERVTVRVNLDTSKLGVPKKGQIPLQITFPANDSVIFFGLLNENAWEPSEIASVAAALRSGETYDVLDIGANVGLFSIQIELAKRAASSAFNFSRFLLFEPVPNIYACLTENLRAASIDNGLAFNVALGNADCSAEMVLDQGNGGNNSLLAEAVDPDWAKTLTVQVRTFASFAQAEGLAFERPILLKIDVQGYEPNVIAGIPENVWSKVQVALIEFWPPYFSKLEPAIRKGLFDRLAHFSRFTRLSDHSVQSCSLNQILDVSERGSEGFFNLLAQR